MIDDDTAVELVRRAAELLGGSSDGNMMYGHVAEDLIRALSMIRNSFDRPTRQRQNEMNDQIREVAEAAENLLKTMQRAGTEALNIIANTRADITRDHYGEEQDLRAILEVGRDARLLAELAWLSIPPVERGRPADGAKRFAIAVCRGLFLKHRKIKPTSYSDGDFVALCEVVLELATGKEQGDLGRQIRTVFAFGTTPIEAVFGTQSIDSS